MRAVDLARRAREHVDVPWDELRAARVQKRVVNALQESPARVDTRRRPLVWVLVAALGLVVVGLLVFRSPASRLDFADGSTVTLGPNAEVVAMEVSHERVEVLHVAGHATYDVAPRPERRFTVLAGSVTVHVVGTAFDVTRDGRSVRVKVHRGQVSVVQRGRQEPLAAGAEIAFDDHSSGSVPEPPAASMAPPPPVAPSGSPSSERAPEAPGAIRDAGAEAAPSAAALFRRADEARARGDNVAALRDLRELIRLYPLDGRAGMALFTIGRLEALRGNSAPAAQAFDACGGGFGGEAWAEAALAWQAAGQPQKARASARRYLDRFPKGPRAAELEGLAK